MPAIRLLSTADLPALVNLSRLASWNQTAADWVRLLTLEPAGCFAIDQNGTLAATATMLRYPPYHAWLGMVLTQPEFRGRGLARRLVEHAILFAGRRTIHLDASDMGQRLYESLGFIEECPIDRYLRQPASVSGREAPAFNYPQALDAEAFGADRSALVALLSPYEAASISNSAFALGRPGENAAYFGPCVSTSPEAVRELLEWFLARHASEPVFWDLFPHHTQASQLAAEFGFRPVRRLTRMSLNAPAPELPDPRIYAIAGFEYG
jgi:GNAT superfamily N-acetyltransferase